MVTESWNGAMRLHRPGHDSGTKRAREGPSPLTPSLRRLSCAGGCLRTNQQSKLATCRVWKTSETTVRMACREQKIVPRASEAVLRILAKTQPQNDSVPAAEIVESFIPAK